VTDRVQLVAIGVSLLLLVAVLDLVRRRKLVEEYSIVWILCALAMLGLSVWRDLLDRGARWLGVYYPPSALLMLLVATVFVALLWFSVILSKQRQLIDRLMEETAVLAAELRDVRGLAGRPTAAERLSAPDRTGGASDRSHLGTPPVAAPEASHPPR
jgi:hypothetical protein